MAKKSVEYPSNMVIVKRSDDVKRKTGNGQVRKGRMRRNLLSK